MERGIAQRSFAALEWDLGRSVGFGTVMATGVAHRRAELELPLTLPSLLTADIQRSERLFGVSPVRFVDDVYNCASQYIKVRIPVWPACTASIEIRFLASRVGSAHGKVAEQWAWWQ